MRGSVGPRGPTECACVERYELVAVRTPGRGDADVNGLQAILAELQAIRSIFEAIHETVAIADARVRELVTQTTGAPSAPAASAKGSLRVWAGPVRGGVASDVAVTGESLRQRREALGVSQATIAHEAHCSRGLVAEVERGRRRNAMTLELLSQAIGKLERERSK